MSYFKAKMHQIRLQLRIRPRPHWGVYNALGACDAPQTLHWAYF